MNDMTPVIVPKSDQLNSDDLIAGPKTIRVAAVDIRAGTEQPVSIHYDGDGGKPYKPCKSMCRIMVAAWGPDAKRYVGRAMTLYRDPAVKWGGMEVGGIRISHMTDIEKTLVLALTATKGSRKPYTVKPLAAQEAARTETQTLIDDARRAATNGVASYQAFFGGLSRDEKAALVNGGYHEENKKMAAKADAPPAPIPDPDDGYSAPSGDLTDADDGRFPPTDGDAIDPIADARQRGAEAKEAGLGTRAMPGEYRAEGREAEAAAWLEGHRGAGEGK